MINKIKNYITIKSNRTLISAISVFLVVALSLISVQIHDNFGEKALIIINIFQIISFISIAIAIIMCIYSVKIDIKNRIDTVKDLKNTKE